MPRGVPHVSQLLRDVGIERTKPGCIRFPILLFSEESILLWALIGAPVAAYARTLRDLATCHQPGSRKCSSCSRRVRAAIMAARPR